MMTDEQSSCDNSGAEEITPISLDDRLREVETSLIIWALKATGGNKSKAATLLKVKRSTLGDRISRYGIDTRRADEAAW